MTTRAPNPFESDRNPITLAPEYLRHLQTELDEELCGADPPPEPPAAIDGPALRRLLRAATPANGGMAGVLEEQLRLDFARLMHSRNGEAVTTREQLNGAINPFVDRVISALYPGQTAEQTRATRDFLARWALQQLVGREGNDLPAAQVPRPFPQNILNRLFAEFARALREVPAEAPPPAPQDARSPLVRELQSPQQGMQRLLRLLTERNNAFGRPIATREDFNAFTTGFGTHVADQFFPPAQRDTEAYRNLRDLATRWAASTMYDLVPGGARPAERPTLDAQNLARLRGLMEFPTNEANRRLVERENGLGDRLTPQEQTALRVARQTRDALPMAPAPRERRPEPQPVTIQNPETWRRMLSDAARRDGAMAQLMRPFFDAMTRDLPRDRQPRTFDNMVDRLTAPEAPDTPHSFVTQTCHMLFPEGQRDTDNYRQFRQQLTDWVRWRVATQLPVNQRPTPMPTQPNLGDMMRLVPRS